MTLARGAVRLDFYVDEYRFSDEFMVIEGLSNEVVIGVNRPLYQLERP